MFLISRCLFHMVIQRPSLPQHCSSTIFTLLVWQKEKEHGQLYVGSFL